jgi:hypothetical protein
MKSKKEILDEFGQLLVTRIIDRHYKGIRKAIYEGLPNPPRNIYNKVFDKLDGEEKLLLLKFFQEIVNSTLFDYLEVFEENEQFKLYYEGDVQRVNLAEISEMLKAEPIIENGWIKRFSKEI